jgi:hypothetical protein
LLLRCSALISLNNSYPLTIGRGEPDRDRRISLFEKWLKSDLIELTTFRPRGGSKLTSRTWTLLDKTTTETLVATGIACTFTKMRKGPPVKSRVCLLLAFFPPFDT